MRRSGSKLCLIAMITATATLTACAPKGSVEQHTRHYVYASDDGFDPNFSTQKADTTRMMVPFFRQFWDMGAKDKATGKSRSDVQQRIQQFHSQEFLTSLQGTTQFAGTDYRSKDLTPKKSRLLADTISGGFYLESLATKAEIACVLHS
ncbi:Exc2 family lipoprotein (plasmid) [Citrobacter koseri]